MAFRFLAQLRAVALFSTEVVGTVVLPGDTELLINPS